MAKNIPGTKTAASDDPGAERIAAAMESLIEKQGSSEKALELLLTENYELRAKNRDLRGQVEEAKKEAPAEGSAILTPEEAKRWADYVALGKPEDLKAGIAERDDLKAKNEAHIRETAIAAIAEANGMNPKVLIRLAGDIEFETKEIEHEGKKISQTSVIVPGPDGKRATAVPLGEYANNNWKEFLPALKAEDRAGGNKPDGTPFIPQRNGAPATDDKDDLVAERLRMKTEASKAAPNPLMATIPGFAPGAGAASESKN